MENRYKELSMEELNQKLKEEEDLLDDLEDERSVILGQSGQHISSTRLAKKYEALLKEAYQRIDEIKACIDRKAKH